MSAHESHGVEPRVDPRLERARLADEESARQSRVAAGLIRDFVAQAASAGLEPEPLRIRGAGGRGRVRTNVRGWFLKRDESVAIDADGLFYVMRLPTSPLAALTGTRIEPSDPPLELGRGGRDGESMPIADALAGRLAAGDAWPG